MNTLFYAARPLLSDLAATLFFYAVLAATGDVRAATLVGMGLGVAQLVYMKLRRRPIALMQWTSLTLVVVMGGATLITHDPRFVLVKASIVYAAIGAAMLQPGWMYRYVPPIATDHLPRALVVGFGYVWAALILGTGGLNLYLTLTAEPKLTAQVIGVWAPSSKIALFAIQYLTFRAIARRSILAERAAQPLEAQAAA
jgi:intracellular septation protein A